MYDCVYNPKYSVHNKNEMKMKNNSLSGKILLHLCFVYFDLIFRFCIIIQCLLEKNC